MSSEDLTTIFFEEWTHNMNNQTDEYLQIKTMLCTDKKKEKVLRHKGLFNSRARYPPLYKSRMYARHRFAKPASPTISEDMENPRRFQKCL